MIRTHVFACSLLRSEADALNRESGRVYTNTLVRHYRIKRKTGHWLSPRAGERVEDSTGPSTLHAHSRDAAQQGFYRACKTARTLQEQGDPDVRYPYRRKRWRTTIWKNTAIPPSAARPASCAWHGAGARPPVTVVLPAHLAALPARCFVKMRLVWDRVACQYTWHLVVDDGITPAPTMATGVVGVDLGEIHPAALTDGTEATIITCRALRSCVQYTNKRLAALRSKQGGHERGSRRWKRLQRRKTQFLARQKRRARDLAHKASRAVVDRAQEHAVGTLAIGDVRHVADGKRLRRSEQHKISQWGHGKLRRYIGYKAEAAGITVVDTVNEAYTSQTCPRCGHRSKPKGRIFVCHVCGFQCARDTVGAANILSRHLYGEVGRVPPPAHTKYRHPAWQGKRSRLDTAHVARTGGLDTSREAHAL
jgi:putative transposase